MSLNDLSEYTVPQRIKSTKDAEQQIIDLLIDVRDNICFVRPDFENQRLDAVLEIVEKEKWVFQKGVHPRKPWVESNYKIDFSEAKQLIINYRFNSEGGCQSCLSLRSYTPFPGDHFKYCEEVEDENFAINNWSNDNSQSPTIKKFYEIGCKNRKPIISRKLEEVLAGYKETFEGRT